MDDINAIEKQLIESVRTDYIYHDAAKKFAGSKFAADLFDVTYVKNSEGVAEVTGLQELPSGEVIAVERHASRRTIGQRVAALIRGNPGRCNIEQIKP